MNPVIRDFDEYSRSTLALENVNLSFFDHQNIPKNSYKIFCDENSLESTDSNQNLTHSQYNDDNRLFWSPNMLYTKILLRSIIKKDIKNVTIYLNNLDEHFIILEMIKEEFPVKIDVIYLNSFRNRDICNVDKEALDFVQKYTLIKKEEFANVVNRIKLEKIINTRKQIN
ncbi:hypothetical protein NUSPORA_00916 [Nucleospora cyclopteri]